MGGVKKEYLPLSVPAPLTVLGAAFSVFASCSQIGPIVITVPENGENAARSSLPPSLLANEDLARRVFFVSGGANRRASVHNALSFLKSHKPSFVLIHDGARPWINLELIERVIEGAIRYKAVIPGLPLPETPKELEASSEGEKFIKRHISRESLCAAQTPQGFAFPEILFAHEKAAEKEAKENFEYTDDAAIWGEFSGPVAVIPGDPENRKISYPADLNEKNSALSKRTEKHVQRIGIGRDLHKLAEGRRFLLGGIEIPFEKGELGHSDGDVLAHAVCDALLGASGLGDIGELYPSGDPTLKDANSFELLQNAWKKVKAQGWRLVNLDCTVCCEKPEILPHREKIRHSLSSALEAEPEAVFVKGKTNEGIFPTGTGDAVEALAVCLIERY
jgi:2-C-methyl-D-erythritol 4-phosphate cytidylyltransferase/2-C-methyl-D-erythritol 2,4-cyclodiphosphate synthase